MSATTFAVAQLLRVLPRTRITRAVGRLCDMPLPPLLSKAVVGAYARAYKVDLSEAVALENGHAYPSFDAFFTRPLRPGARRLDAPADALMAPADGRLDAQGRVTADGTIMVKGRPYRAVDLLGCPAAAERYFGGQFAVIYLSPRDYHRVHAPVAGKLVEVRSYPGELFPVNQLSERHIPNFLARNRRVALELESIHHGQVTVVMVAAMIVGRVTAVGIDAADVPLGTQRPSPAIALDCGAELACFHLGSTAVLFFEPDRVPPLDRPLGPILLGEALTRSAETTPASARKGAHG